jgi:hypothetical protein
MRIARPDTAFSLQPKTAKARKDSGYLAWLHEVPCIVTGTLPVEAAHLSTANPKYGHMGRGKGQKAHDRWALPLSQDEHRLQHHQGEATYWRERWVRLGIKPHFTALVLHGLYLDGVSPADAYRIIKNRYQDHDNG